MQEPEKAFTLMEVLIVIVILGILASFITGNFITSLKRGRDAKRKSDLKEVQKALEFYYENNNEYPLYLYFGGKLEDSNGKIYMQKLPQDPLSDCSYNYIIDRNNQTYYILSTIENKEDISPNISHTGYKNPNGNNKLSCGNCDCNFYLSSPNADPLQNF